MLDSAVLLQKIMLLDATGQINHLDEKLVRVRVILQARQSARGTEL